MNTFFALGIWRGTGAAGTEDGACALMNEAERNSRSSREMNRGLILCMRLSILTSASLRTGHLTCFQTITLKLRGMLQPERCNRNRCVHFDLTFITSPFRGDRHDLGGCG